MKVDARKVVASKKIAVIFASIALAHAWTLRNTFAPPRAPLSRARVLPSNIVFLLSHLSHLFPDEGKTNDKSGEITATKRPYFAVTRLEKQEESSPLREIHPLYKPEC